MNGIPRDQVTDYENFHNCSLVMNDVGKAAPDLPCLHPCLDLAYSFFCGKAQWTRVTDF